MPEWCGHVLDFAPYIPSLASLLGNTMTEAHYEQARTKREKGYDLANRIERSGLDTYEARALVKDTSHG